MQETWRQNILHETTRRQKNKCLYGCTVCMALMYEGFELVNEQVNHWILFLESCERMVGASKGSYPSGDVVGWEGGSHGFKGSPPGWPFLSQRGSWWWRRCGRCSVSPPGWPRPRPGPGGSGTRGPCAPEGPRLCRSSPAGTNGGIAVIERSRGWMERGRDGGNGLREGVVDGNNYSNGHQGGEVSL